MQFYAKLIHFPEQNKQEKIKDKITDPEEGVVCTLNLYEIFI